MLGESKDWHHMMLFFILHTFCVFTSLLWFSRCSDLRLCSVWIKKIFPCLFSHRVGGQSWVFFLFAVWGQRCSFPTEHSCFHPWILSIIDGTPTASQAGIAWKKKLGKPDAILPVPELRTGDRAPLGRQLAPAIYSRLLGVTVWRHAQRQTHTHTHWQAPLESHWPTPLTTLLICGPKMWKPIEVIINDSSIPENVKCGLGA